MKVLKKDFKNYKEVKKMINWIKRIWSKIFKKQSPLIDNEAQARGRVYRSTKKGIILK